MRILIQSRWFSPTIGGVETTSRILAQEFIKSGSSVAVATVTSGATEGFGFPVIRNPSYKVLSSAVDKADVVLQNILSLRTMAPGLLLRKPTVIIHNSWLRRPDGTRGIENYIKLVALRACHNVSVSRAIADSLPVSSELIFNPFEPGEFEPGRETPKDRDIVFMGRVILDKGCDLLLRAIQAIKERGVCPSVTVIGDGPDLPALKAMAGELGIANQVEFKGSLEQGRGQVVSRHRIMAIPSRWAEPFGVVALEGIAAGCAIVASNQGGLRDAAGPCARYFPNGDVRALADSLYELLTDGKLREQLVAAGPEHLKSFRPKTIAEQYLEIFKRIV